MSIIVVSGGHYTTGERGFNSRDRVAKFSPLIKMNTAEMSIAAIGRAMLAAELRTLHAPVAHAAAPRLG